MSTQLYTDDKHGVAELIATRVASAAHQQEIPYELLIEDAPGGIKTQGWLVSLVESGLDLKKRRFEPDISVAHQVPDALIGPDMDVLYGVISKAATEYFTSDKDTPAEG